MNCKGQITIFVIIAILLVVAIILAFTLYNKTIIDKAIVSAEEPQGFMEQCISDYVDEASEKIIQNGGYFNEEDKRILSMQYEYADVPYLCFYSENNARCNPRIEVSIYNHVESEIYTHVNSKVNSCFDMMIKELKDQEIKLEGGYTLDIEMLSGKVRTTINQKVRTEKAGVPKTYDAFSSVTQTKVYDFAEIVQRIIEEEVIYCDSDPIKIMNANRDFEVKRWKTGNDNTIYTITNKNTKEVWRFATRGCVLDTPS